MKRVLNYPGSKWNIAPSIVSRIPEHHSYVEPFFGSGAVLFNKPVSDIETVNDLDSDVTNLFMCIQRDSERLARLAMTTPFSRDIYDSSFIRSETDDYIDNFERAVDFLVKCWQGYGFRTNRYKVGWKNDVVGREKAYALWNWYRLPEWVIDVAERLRMVQIENKPALELIKHFNKPGVFMYIDPPYLFETRSGKQYKYEMFDKDHEEMLRELLKSNAKIMISGYESDMYNDYLHTWNKTCFNSCAEHGKRRKEVIWMNYSDKQLSFADFPELMP